MTEMCRYISEAVHARAVPQGGHRGPRLASLRVIFRVDHVEPGATAVSDGWGAYPFQGPPLEIARPTLIPGSSLRPWQSTRGPTLAERLVNGRR
jgi:hypothetical protein